MTAKTGAQSTREAHDSTQWQCLTCEYVVESIPLPFSCPRCGASRVKFVELKAGQPAAEAEE
jgi:rubrerythrin